MKKTQYTQACTAKVAPRVRRAIDKIALEGEMTMGEVVRALLQLGLDHYQYQRRSEQT
jgi:hypothetical protein